MKKVQKLAKEIREYISKDKLIQWEVENTRNSMSCIKSILDKHAPIEKPFPKHMVCTLGNATGAIVYFSKKRVGRLCNRNEIDGVMKGQKWKTWVMCNFEDCEITIK